MYASRFKKNTKWSTTWETKIFQDPRLLQTSGIFYSVSSLGENGETT